MMSRGYPALGGALVLAAMSQPVLAQAVAALPPDRETSAPVTVAAPPPAGSVTVLVAPAGPAVKIARAADGAGAMASVEPLPGPDTAEPASSRNRKVGVSSGYGYRIHPIYRSVRFHSGIDLARPAGTRVLAATGGIVTRAGWAAGYGLLVTIDHGSGVETRYAHLASIAVGPGQRLGKGDLIGLVGSTGRSTGPHLHYEVRRNGRAVSPVPARKGQ